MTLGGNAAKSNVGRIRRNDELLDAISVAGGPTLLRFVRQRDRPQVSGRAFRVHDPHVELLLLALLVILFLAVGRQEKDARAIRAPGPNAHRCRVLGELHRRFFPLQAGQPDLAFFSLAGRVGRPFAIAAEREGVHAVFRVANLAGFAAIDSHQIELVRAFPVGKETNRSAVTSPLRLRFVLLLGEGHLPRRHRAIGRGHENVGEVLSHLPLRDRDGIDDVLAVGRDFARADAAHLDDVDKRHRPLLLRRAGCNRRYRHQPRAHRYDPAPGIRFHPHCQLPSWLYPAGPGECMQEFGAAQCHWFQTRLCELGNSGRKCNHAGSFSPAARDSSERKR